ncbi:hypothetical protein FF38_07809 [Lucilia cuprina]|uniref:Short neuropeptide F n=1 Tax=Lucilia cuprina TaxID=7375 RepID=A0A0L0BYL1_LUCCU|nr:hypothetical protein CVS40_10909 [Lucilia cuprina]KAI8117130.1 hypothetical protein CVS40_10909 [Lucilia cuprina]KNC25105.1 hypothetical protein FF38_07809 [Lucilia cuprina]
MTAVNGKIFLVLSMMLALAWCQQHYQQISDSEVPAVLSYNSPLRQPDSLRSRPYFDFLSTLYRRDADKTQLFRPYVRNRREIIAPVALDLNVAQHERSKRAIVFRPLFVYRQQEIRKQQLQNQRRRRV